MKPTRVLIPIDFSDTSLRALRYGFSVAEAFSAEVTLVHVLVLPANERAVREAEERLTALLPESFRTKAGIRVPLVTSTIEAELLATVQETGADLVVLGTRGLRPFMRFLLGSTTEHLLRVMPVPLITVSDAEETQELPVSLIPSLKRILYPTDFSEPTESALPTALEFARHFGAELELVHVVEHLERPLAASRLTDSQIKTEQRTWVQHAQESLERIIEAADVAEVTVSSSVLEGRPWQAILAHAAFTRPDLIAMSLHGKGFLERALLGATAERVIRDSPVPVLGIPATGAP